MSDRILILDFGSQVTQLIARRVRESGVYCEIQPFQSVNSERILAFRPKGLILSGGPASVHKIETPRAAEIIFDGSLGVPVLGICYGEQTMVQQMGGKVTPSDQQEFGRAALEVTGECVFTCWHLGKRLDLRQKWIYFSTRPRFKKWTARPARHTQKQLHA